MATKIGEYKGQKTISLFNSEDEKYPFSFGLKKAELIIANLEDIKKFIEDNKKEE